VGAHKTNRQEEVHNPAVPQKTQNLPAHTPSTIHSAYHHEVAIDPSQSQFQASKTNMKSIAHHEVVYVTTVLHLASVTMTYTPQVSARTTHCAHISVVEDCRGRVVWAVGCILLLMTRSSVAKEDMEGMTPWHRQARGMTL
jgi:hypothetical protein